MGKITVCCPVESNRATERIELARRGAIPANAALTLIENGKPNARALLRAIAEELRSRLPVGTVTLFSKPSAARPIEADEARMLAARSQLIITGLGD